MIDLPRSHHHESPLAPTPPHRPPPPISGQSAWDLLVHESAACIGLMDASGNYLFANEQLERAVGVSRGGLIGRTLDGLISRSAMQQRRAELRWVIEQRSTLAVICIMRGVCWKVTMKPVCSTGFLHTDTQPDIAEDEHHLSMQHQEIDSLAAAPPISAVLCICVRLAHVAAGESRAASPASAASMSAGALSTLSSVWPWAQIADLPVALMPDLGPLGRLTPRELQVLRLVGLGLTIAQMARRVHRAEKTLEWHRNALGTKLGIRNRVELARLAMESGLTALSDVQMDQVLANIEKSPD